MSELMQRIRGGVVQTVRDSFQIFDSPGGHIVLVILLFYTGIWMTFFKIPKAEDIIVGSFGALLTMVRGPANRGNDKI